MVKLWQNIDTLKYHLYPSQDMTPEDITGYNLLMDKLLSLKLGAQSNKNENKSFAQFQYNFKGADFQVSPSTVRGFSVSIKNHDVTIHMKKLVLSIDQSPFCKVEFRAHFLQRYGYLGAVQRVGKFLKENIMSSFVIKISEIHLHCDVQGYEFTSLDFHKFQTRARKNRIYEEEQTSGEARFFAGRRFQGMMVGGGDHMMRIYNKTQEIKTFPNKSYIEELWKTNKDYDPSKNVFRIEFQLRREKLKNMVIDGVVMDGFEIILNNLNNIWGRCLEDFRFFDIEDNKALSIMLGFTHTKEGDRKILPVETIRTWFKRAVIHPLWNLINSFNGHFKTETITTYIKPFKPHFIYVNNAFKAFLFTCLSHFGHLNPAAIEDAIFRVKEYTEKKHEETILENVYKKRLDRFNKFEVKSPYDETYLDSREGVVSNLLNTLQNTYSSIFDKGLGDIYAYLAEKRSFLLRHSTPCVNF